MAISPSHHRQSPDQTRHIVVPFIAGAAAGLAVDVALFPVDTIKTRLQSPRGFLRSGGFSRLYLGLGSTLSGSAPGAALFFLTYESTKQLLSRDSHGSHMGAAIAGETVACLVRVPVEVVKQRAQAYHLASFSVLHQTLAQSGARGLYRGYMSTLFREIPFALIQFPLWEHLKNLWRKRQRSPLSPFQAMICGSASGAVAGFLTTPLDVAKTTIMLESFGEAASSSHYLRTLTFIYEQRGIRGLFAGALPRVAWIAAGGAIFLGGYDLLTQLLTAKC